MDLIRSRLRPPEAMIQEIIRSSLRLPGLIMLELFLRDQMKNESERNFHEKIQNEFRSWLEYVELPQLIKSRNFDGIIEVVLNCSVLIFGGTLIFLPTKKLISMYLHLVSVVLLGAGYYLSYRYVRHEQATSRDDDDDGHVLDDFVKLERHGFHLLCQLVLAVVVSCMLSIRSGFARAGLTVCALPIVARLCGFSIEKLHVVHNFSCCFLMLLVCFYVLNCVPVVLVTLRGAETWTKSMIKSKGYVNTFVEIWRYAKLPTLFALFWCALCLSETYTTRKSITMSMTSSSSEAKRAYAELLYCFANCCATPLSLLGFCSATYYFSYFSLLATKIYLKGGSLEDTRLNDPEVAHGGYAESVTLMILAFQTDLVNRSAEHKAFLICILLFIILSSLLQSVYDVVDPSLLQIGASQSVDYWRHGRALSLCSALFVVPIVMSISIAILLPIDVWLMIIISSCVLISVQTFGSIIIYALFVYDANRSRGSWSHLDDLVYYCRAIIRFMEFLVAFSVIAYGVYESVFGEWSWANSSILIIHCYFNVWQRLQAGWHSFLLRRDAAKKLDMLPVAGRQQLESLQDVCAICYQELNEARVTPCNHFFHGSCLKKWLYVKQACPMCHYDLNFKTRNSSTNGNTNNGGHVIVQNQQPNNSQDDEEGYSSEERQSNANFDTVSEDDSDRND